MLISQVIQIRSKLNERIIKLDAILTKLGGKTYIITHIIASPWFQWVARTPLPPPPKKKKID